jgi:DNA-binding response OmpR family regulator
MLVEGDPPTRELYARELGRDFAVLVCTDRDQAVDLLQTQPVIAVVIEPASAGGAGWHVLASIGGICAERAIPIIVCSTLEERRRGQQLGATLYLVKPTLPTALSDALRHVLQARFFRS